MRWIFVGVVVLNLLFLGWHLARDPADAGAPQVAAKATEYPARLELVGDAATGPAVAPVRLPVLPGCPALGPLTEADGQRVAAALRAAGFETGSRVVEIKSARVFWVYLPPFADRPQAMRKLRELQARGVDSFLVTEGPGANAISLGSFTNRDSAVGLQSRLRSAGYAAEVKEESRDVQQGWVVLTEPGAQGYLEHVPAELVEKLRQERMDCGLAR